MRYLSLVRQFLLGLLVFASSAGDSTWAAPQTTATSEVSLTKVSVNSDFENGIGGWQSVTSNAKVVTRNWTPDPTSDFSLKRLGQKAVSLNGDGYFSQWLAIAPGTKYHVAQIKAARRPYVAFTDPLAEGWAGFGITYYDAHWNEIDDVYEEIYGVNQADPAKSYSGLVAYSVGGIVPPNAVFATLWCTNHSLKSEIIIDDFGMFSLTFNPPTTPGVPLAILQSAFRPLPTEADLRQDLFVRPGEVWRLTNFGITIADRGFTVVTVGRPGFPQLQVGRSNRPVTMAQLIPAVSDKKLTLTLTEGFTSKDAGVVGVDCYDNTGAKIATVSSLLKENTATGAFNVPLEQKVVTLSLLVPLKTHSAYYWVWIGQGKSMVIPSITLDISP